MAKSVTPKSSATNLSSPPAKLARAAPRKPSRSPAPVPAPVKPRGTVGISRSRKTSGTRSAKPITPAPVAAGSKQSQLISLMRKPSGATLAELMQVTGWQAHSVRGVISGALKKRLGLTVITEKASDGLRRYRIAGHGAV